MTEEIAVTRSERLLALLVLHNMADASQIEKCVQLNRAGFGNAEIAELLVTTTPTVTQNLYEARKSKVGKRPSKKGAKKTAKGSPAKTAKRTPKKAAKRTRRKSRR